MSNIFFNINDLKKCGKNVIIGKTVRIRHPEKVTVGDNVIIDDFTYISGEVCIGSYTHIAASTTISASKSKVVIGSYVGIASGVRIFAGSSDYFHCGLDIPTIPDEHIYGVIYGEVNIANSCLIGANAVVMPSVSLPEGVAVSAGMSVRDKDYTPWTLLVTDTPKPIKRRGLKKYLGAINKLRSEG